MGKYSTHRGNMWVVGTRLRYHIVEEGGSREEEGGKEENFQSLELE
jgi:hypothetical protein